MINFSFTDREQIIELINETDNFEETNNIIQENKELKKLREPFYLNKQEFENILLWKLRTQYERQKNTGNKTPMPLFKK